MMQSGLEGRWVPLLENYIFIKVAGCCFSGGPVAAAVINRTVLFM